MVEQLELLADTETEKAKINFCVVGSANSFPLRCKVKPEIRVFTPALSHDVDGFGRCSSF